MRWYTLVRIIDPRQETGGTRRMPAFLARWLTSNHDHMDYVR